MTPYNKKLVQRTVEHLKVDSSTNIWAGIKSGLDVFKSASPSTNVQGLYLLTDGQPNLGCPSKGYAAALKPLLAQLAQMNQQVPTIHTFGFGYDIRSGLLQTVAEIGLGSYAFIPDASMIGTVFVHAVANSYSTYATQAVLTVYSSDNSRLVCSTVMNISHDGGVTHMRLGNLQYGQSRDVVIDFPDSGSCSIEAVLYYTNSYGTACHLVIPESSAVHPDHQYHLLRSELCGWLAGLFPKQNDGEHRAYTSAIKLKEARQALDVLSNTMQPIIDREGIHSLYLDAVGEDFEGQITQALKPAAWKRWGQHFLPSLLHAYARQVCNSFKDPGPMEFGKNSALFTHYRDALDAAFESLPPPAPSRAHVTNGPIVTNFTMARFHNSGGGCFDGNCLVRLADETRLPIKWLQPRMRVWTPMGPRLVRAVVKQVHPRSAESFKLVRVGQVWLTPWHPLKHDGRWTFPDEIAEQRIRSRGDIYSVLLEASSDTEAHAIEVGGETCVTLGHGLIDKSLSNDVRAHPFFGNYDTAKNDLQYLPTNKKGQHLSQGLRREGLTGLVCGWVPCVEPLASTPAAPLTHRLRELEVQA
jgi:hypothetical protein